MTTSRRNAPPARSARIRAFATFFKSYMSVSTLVAASIPIPITTWKLIPIYSAQRGFLTVYTSLFCFLLLAFVFSIRHRLAVWMFSRGRLAAVMASLPLVFIVSTLACILAYHALLEQSVQQLRSLGITATTGELLAKMDATEIPRSLALAATYLCIFVFAEAAFVLMAIREYLQDLLRLDEVSLLRGEPGLSPAPASTDPPSI